MTASGVVHVIDDDASWRTSVARLLSAAGYQAAVYDSADRFLDSPVADGAGCILLDVRMPGITGLQLQQRLVELRRELPIVFVSGHGDVPMTVRAMKAGAEDFLTKPVDSDALLQAVSRAIERQRSERAGREQLEAMRLLLRTLTPAERRVFDEVIKGKLNKQIGADLGTTERTVKWHRHNLMEKLHVRSVAELVSLAERSDQTPLKTGAPPRPGNPHQRTVLPGRMAG